MKVFMPITGESHIEDVKITSMYGSEKICVYDTESETLDSMSMSDLTDKPENLCVILKLKGITNVICQGMPLLSYSLFSEMGFRLYKPADSTMIDNIKLFNVNELRKLKAMDSVETEDCLGACASCKSHSCK